MTSLALLLGLVSLASLVAGTTLGPARTISTAYTSPQDAPPSCSSDIYCKGPLLHVVQTSEIYVDSKTFVDKKVRESPEIAMKRFNTLMKDTDNKPTHDQVLAFVDAAFEDGDELEEWTPGDWAASPALLSRIQDDTYRDWASNLNKLWLRLGRKMKQDVRDNPQLYSLIYVPHGFVIPGGRFKELYYWDSYWIVKGLLWCDMDNTVKGVIENLISLVKKLGFVPNGSRVYYEERSQPPLLTAMARAYFDKTKDMDFLRNNIDTLEKEFQYWINNTLVEVEKDGSSYKLARYFFLSNGPRPESYREDYKTTEHLASTDERERMYWELKSGAATGWDFSSRWFIDSMGTNNGELKDIKTTKIIPVDLNAFLYGAAKSLQYFKSVLNDRLGSAAYGQIAEDFRRGVEAVLWNEKDGIWYDYDLLNKKQRQYFYGSNLAPLWTYCYDTDKTEDIATKVVRYIDHSGVLAYRGGTPSSLNRTGEQWDFPNCWAPLQAFIIQGLENTAQEEAMLVARELAERWLHANFVGYRRTQKMFEKYDAEDVGSFGGGGEYEVQEGFGWSNGLVFELLAKYSSKGSNNISGNSAELPGLLSGLSGQDISNSISHVVDRVRKGVGQGAQSLDKQEQQQPAAS